MALETLQRTIFLYSSSDTHGDVSRKDVTGKVETPLPCLHHGTPLSQWTPAKASGADRTGPILEARRG